MNFVVAAVTSLVLMGVATTTAAPTDSLRDQLRPYIEAHEDAILAELTALLSIPNVASDRANIRRNAEHLKVMLAKRGFASELLETSGNPLVYGDLRAPGATRTLLLYAHYDGQAVNPAAWHQPDPFTPVMREGRIYARSASDDKGPIVMICAALDALKANGLQPSSNIRVVLDGEEEASSPSLVPAIAKYREKFAADMMLIFDGPIHPSARPTVAFGGRGILTGTLTVYGPKSGVHSGNYGNWIPNPALRLAHLLASMKDDRGEVLVPGFYDGLPPLTPEERAMLAAVPDEAARMLKTFGVAEPEVPGRSLQEGFQIPTLNIRGLTSAHVGPGARTIIPDRAVAEIDIRLVKETRSSAMRDKVNAHITAQGYHLVSGEPDDETRAKYSHIASIDWDVNATEAFRTSPADPQARALVEGLTRAYGAPPVQIRTLGGTVPIAPFIDALGFPAALVPTVNFDNNQHEENENLRVSYLFDGIITVAAVLRM